MLKVVNSKPCAHSSIQFDRYIAFDIELEGSVDGEGLLYWSAEEDAKSLVDIGVRPSDGRIESVTVVSINLPSLSVSQSDIAFAEVEEIRAAPCVDLTMWPPEARTWETKYVYETCPISLSVGKESAEVWFTKERAVERWLAVGKVRFGVLEDLLVCVQIVEVSPSELAGVRDCVSRR